jgi:D-alanine--poly(phosphoribitol) ligase subunit 1
MKRTLQSYFHSSALKDAESPALHIGEKYFSYGDLWHVSREVSRFLCSNLHGEGQHCVGVLCEKTLSAYAGLLGAMESGNIYVPLNPKLPLNRLEHIAKHARIKALIVDVRSVSKASQLLALLDDDIVTFLPENDCVPAELQNHAAFSAQSSNGHAVPRANGGAVEPAGGGRSYAYLLFTSGSTGAPKGVPVTHENASACIEAVCERFEIRNSDRFTQFSELSFDVSIGDIFLCWKAGACLYIPSFAEVMTPVEFAARHKLTVWSSVPTLANNVRALGALKPGSLSSLRYSFFCGEALPTALTRDWQAAAPSCVIVNFYGPTEAAIFSTFYVCDKRHDPAEDIVPLGVPLSGFRFRILREDSAPSDPEGGELLLSGPQVATGYWNDKSATGKAFVRIPDDETGQIWYRTGDRVSLNDRNELVFHGRCDRQVKMRGYRIELDEVEAILRRVTDSDLVAVIPVYANDGRCEDIVGFCDRGSGGEEEIRRQCSAHLPVYMVPRRIIRLDDFPRSTNGKLDYRLLATYTGGTFPASKPVEN